MPSTLVFAERDENGDLRRSTLELLTLARRLGEAAAVISGDPDERVTARLGEYGSALVLWCEGAEEPDSQARVLEAAARHYRPNAVLIASGPEGKRLAARLAVRLDCGIVTDAVDVEPGPVAVQSVCAGAWTVRSEGRGDCLVITVRANAVSPEPAPVSPRVERIEAGPLGEGHGFRVVSRTPLEKGGRPALGEAAIVVSAGRGVGSAEGFAVIERLADVLGGAVGASRGATDEHWYPREFQIGQTGQTVAPRLYLAAGISGAIQHRAGMQGSRTVVAINKDPKAPIFEVAAFGIVGDLHAVIPALLDEIGKRS